MAKLYPPYLEGTLPAFCLTDIDGVEAYDSSKIYNKDDKVYIGEGERSYFSSLIDNNNHNPFDDIANDY